jgi:hypothetical protein
MRNQNVVHIGEHIADVIVPSLHCLVEFEILFSKARKVLLHRLELSLPMLSVGGPTAPVADVGVLEHQRNDAVKEFFSFLPGVLVNECSSVMQ